MVASLTQFERALVRERGRMGGRPRAISDEKLDVTAAALAEGKSKADVARAPEVNWTTLYRELERRRAVPDSAAE